MKKVLTSQKLLPCLIIENKGVVIQKTNGEFVFHSQTNFVSREDVLKSYNGEEKETFLKRFDFDEAPFILALEKKEKVAKEKIKAAKEAEEKRVEDLRNEIARISNPRDLADYFNLKIIEIGSHWSDLLEGRSTYAVLIENQSDNEIMELAREIHLIEGEFGEAKNRAGEHHHTFTRHCDLGNYQENCKNHFSGNDYFFKSQETEKPYLLKKIKECEELEEVQDILKEYEELEEGYYDCSGNLQISSKDLYSTNFTGYKEDVYTYSFCFKFENKNKFN